MYEDDKAPVNEPLDIDEEEVEQAEPKVEKEVIAFVPDEGAEPVEGKRAGQSGRGWSAVEGVATVKTTTTTVDPETGEEVVEETVEENVRLTQSTNPGGQKVYKGLNGDEGEPKPPKAGRVVDASGRSTTRGKKE